ncbi:MAG: FtsW/RodA/SpoVE family cell cycle protein [Paramuribaculum sp.]|nr:FtsW/RodA/SpoVE family cell cycle protein [Paramuribaculum sp.]
MESTLSDRISPANDEKKAPAPVAKGDRHLWGIYIILVFIGLVELYSASSRSVRYSPMGVYMPILAPATLLAGGLFIILCLQRTHYRVILKAIPYFALFSVGLMILTLFVGTNINSATRAIDLKLFTIQPSELLKLSAAMLVAMFAARYQKEGGGVSKMGIIWSAGVILLFCAMLAPQGLTNTLLLMSISGSMMIIGGFEWKKIGIVLLVYISLFGVYLAVTTLFKEEKPKTEQAENRTGVWHDRLANFFDNSVPKYERKLTSENRQEMLSYMAQAKGGVTGVLPGNSREASRLPLAHTDYIYAIVIEELGLVGGILVLVLYLWLLMRAAAIASRCKRTFPALLVIGMALVIVYQALFHVCIVTGVFPVSGQPLPLISKGGSSVITTSIAFGVMLSVSRFAVSNKASRAEIKNEEEALPETARAENPTQL